MSRQERLKQNSADWWKSEGDTIDAQHASILLRRLLDQPHARAFLGIQDQEVSGLVRFMSDIHGGSSQKDSAILIRYHELIRRVMQLPRKEPHMVIPYPAEEGRVHLVLSDGKERLAEQRNGVYFLLSEVQVAPPDMIEVQARMVRLTACHYFPQFKIVHDTQATYIAIEFIDGTTPERGVNVSDFITACRQMNFGPDTNVTNFKQTKDGQLKYIDHDAVEWLVHPATHPFIENSHVSRDRIW